MRWITAILLLLLALSPASASAARLLAIAPHDGGGRYRLHGEFGDPCARCEVVVEYARDLHYAATIERWEPARLVVRIPDLNQGPGVRVQVRGNDAASEWLALELAPVLVPRPALDVPLAPQALRATGFLERRHDLAVGDKGEEWLDVSATAPACGKPAALFDHARIVYAERRFGEAQIVAAPPSGCSKCAPLAVRWYHEPTGHLTYQVHVYRRLVEAPCPARVR